VRFANQPKSATLNSIVPFLKKVFELSLRKASNKSFESINLPFFKLFHRILIEDSTQGRLHEKLADKFKGNGGAAGKSSWKIDLLWDAKTKEIVEMELTSGRVSDMTLGEIITKCIRENDLVVQGVLMKKI